MTKGHPMKHLIKQALHEVASQAVKEIVAAIRDTQWTVTITPTNAPTRSDAAHE